MRHDPVTAVRLFIATMAGVGFIPFASGTWGTLATIPLWAALVRFAPPAWYLPVTLVVILSSVWACGPCERVYGRKDPSQAVADEMSGYLVTMAFVPAGLWTAIAGFFVFRLTDIVKPWPARRFESLPGGLGIVADDVMAGVWGCAIMHAGLWLACRFSA